MKDEQRDPQVADPWADNQPSCRVFPAETPLEPLLHDLIGNCVNFEQGDAPPSRYAVVVDCLHSTAAIKPARQAHAGRPIMAVVARPDAVEALEALSADVEGIICLTDAGTTWRDCVNVLLGGGRWFGGPGVEISLERRQATYGVSRGADTGDITARTRTFVRQNVSDKLHR